MSLSSHATPLLLDASRVLLYLDPGTGSLLFSVIAAMATTAYFVAKELLYRVGGGVRMLLSPRAAAALRQARRTEHGVVVYSEGRQYASTFGPLLAEMRRRGVPCLYLSSDPADPLLAWAGEGNGALLRTECIGAGPLAWGRLRTLRARLVCMTTPGLDVLQIRRSPKVRHYMHIVHSPTDKSFNRPYSFDFFDSVLISGPHQARVIRTLEEIRHRSRKDLISVGCLYYDTLLPKYTASRERAGPSPHGGPVRVLVAPTWGKNGLLSRHGDGLIARMAAAGLDVVIRPHPQSAVSEKDLLDRLKAQTAPFTNCRWDETADPADAMAWSDILVSDISGIVFDYAFLTGRAVLTLDFVVDKRGFEAMDLPFEPWELEVLDVIGRRITLHDIDHLEAIVRNEAANQARAERIRELRDRHVLNFGRSSVAAVDAIEQMAAAGGRS